MGRGDWGKTERVVREGELEKVLDHYGVSYSYRNSQMVCCPLHEDHTPSLSVNFDKQVWKCHSCGEAGGALHLIAKKEGVDLGRARAIGADRSLLERGAEQSSCLVLDGTDQLTGRARLSQQSRAGRDNRAYSPAWRRNRSNSGA